MDITWLGHASFRIKGKRATLVTDPYDSGMIGLKFPKTEADIVTVSHDHKDHNAAGAVAALSADGPFVVDGPGEYEIKGVTIFGIHTWHDDKQGAERGPNTVYTIVMDGLHLCHLGDLGHKPTEEQLGQIGDVDILFIPVGGVYTIDAARGAEVVSVIEPKVVIPMHYKVPTLAQATFASLASVEDFIKEIGAEPIRLDKYTVTVDKLPEERQVVVLELRSST